MLDMKSASIRTVQHQLAAMIAEVETRGEIVITRHGRPVARLAPVAPDNGSPAAAGSPAAIRSYWRRRPLPPAVQSTVTHEELVADSRGPV
jgi:prevent-host-death family protein